MADGRNVAAGNVAAGNCRLDCKDDAQDEMLVSVTAVLKEQAQVHKSKPLS